VDSCELEIQARREHLETYKMLKDEIANFRKTISTIQFGNVAATVTILTLAAKAIPGSPNDYPNGYGLIFLLPLIIYLPSLLHIIVRKKCIERNAAYMYVFLEDPEKFSIRWETRYRRPEGDFKKSLLQPALSFQVNRGYLNIGFETTILYLLMVFSCLYSAHLFGGIEFLNFDSESQKFLWVIVLAWATVASLVLCIAYLWWVYHTSFNRMVKDYEDVLLAEKIRANSQNQASA
jgi:hypothetical protein